MERRKNTTVAPRRPRRYSEGDFHTACGEEPVIASGGDNPDWLVGAN